jgi:uncharacterized protein
MSTNKKPNRLIAEKSPYLLQHAYNPVEWYPWGEEAFEKAKRENKPVFVSIGYSTCHWCHVMERESFEDEEVAALLNERFVSIKVDREERPDLDSIYMSVCQLMIGQGGWPLNVFLTPDQVPFYAGTYFPKESRQGRPGMKDVVVQLYDTFINEPNKISKVGEQIRAAIQPEAITVSDSKLSKDTVEDTFQQFLERFDQQHGGFGNAPKFPSPHNLTFLLRYYYDKKDERALNMVLKTLDGLARGGIYDHIGFGFSRYSVDELFLVPHFEKMLYDNAMLAIAYTEAYQITNHKSLKDTVDQVFTYVLRDMRHPDSGFYSAEDADSEGVEGKFYVWDPDEVEEVLCEDLAELFCAVYDITETGNFEGSNIPNLIREPVESFAMHNGLDADKLKEQLEAVRQKLFEHREKRIHPHKDDKILTSWNALMIAALAKAARVFGSESYLTAAKQALDFIESKLIVDGRIMVRFRDGEVKQKGFIDDYAYLTWAYLEMYEASLDLGFLDKAHKTVQNMINLFWDQEKGGFFFYGSDSEELLVRPKEVYDGALPSGNSVAALQMLRLARLTGDFKLEEKVHLMLKAFSNEISRYPTGSTYMLQALMTSEMKMKETIVLAEREDRGPFVMQLQQQFFPEVTYLVSSDSIKLSEIAPFTADYKKQEGKTTIYICENFVCHNPLTDQLEAIDLLSR